MQHINGTTLWTAELIRERLIEAYELDRRLPGRVGPERLRSAWQVMPASIDTFADKVAQGEASRAEVWHRWAQSGGLTPAEVDRMDAALAWPARFLLPTHMVEARCLRAWALCRSRGWSVSGMLRARGLSRVGFYRLVDRGAQRIATALELTGA